MSDLQHEKNLCLDGHIHFWWFFLLSSLATFICGVMLVLVGRCLIWLWKYLSRSSSSYARRKLPLPCLRWSNNWAKQLISGQTPTGRILISLVFFCSIGSLLIYSIDANQSDGQLCLDSLVTPIIDFVFNLFFTVYFIIRFIASNDRLRFMFELNSFVDYFTIPPSFMSICWGKTWIGPRFLRALGLMTVPDILQYLNLLTTSNSIRFAQLTSIFVSVWLTASGFIHLLENTGDPPDFSNGQRLSYGNCMYFMMVTMTTVGYGDIYCVTSLGKSFQVIFLLGGLAMFASCIPEILELISVRPKYMEKYKSSLGHKHIIVCGHITFESVSNFLRNFLHPDREVKNVEVVFLHPTPPDLELECLFKRHFTSVKFFLGSIMNIADMKRVELDQASACMVLANKSCLNPDAEDAANVMRVISIKNYYKSIRVIVQLLQYQSKAYLLNIPSWDWSNGDEVICVAELKLGILAQSCFAQGFSTMMANLISMHSFVAPLSEEVEDYVWQPDYLEGTDCEIYMERLSPCFTDLTFAQVAEFCFVYLNLLLVAVEVAVSEESDGLSLGSKIVINPRNHVLSDNSVGFFIANSADEVKRAWHYCQRCHQLVVRPDQITLCACKDLRNVGKKYAMMKKCVPFGKDVDPEAAPSLISISKAKTVPPRHELQLSDVDATTVMTQSELSPPDFDYTGMFHWTSSRSLEECLLDRKQAQERFRGGHVIVCLFADPDSPMSGLINLMMPLRASNLNPDQLKEVVIVGNLAYLRKEWRTLQNLPLISVLDGNALNHADMKAVGVDLCDVCLILSAKVPNNEDHTLVDKEVILASLNINAMRFNRQSKDPAIITVLANDSNVQFLDADDEDDPENELYLTQPFACGRAFTVSVLDSMMSTAYFNQSALTLIRSLITGGATPELEVILAEESSIRQGQLHEDDPFWLDTHRDRCVVDQVALHILGPGMSCYQELFVMCLRKFSMLCLGLYRLCEPHLSSNSGQRFVITNPPPAFHLLRTDQVFVLRQFGPVPSRA